MIGAIIIAVAILITIFKIVKRIIALENEIAKLKEEKRENSEDIKEIIDNAKSTLVDLEEIMRNYPGLWEDIEPYLYGKYPDDNSIRWELHRIENTITGYYRKRAELESRTIRKEELKEKLEDNFYTRVEADERSRQRVAEFYRKHPRKEDY